MSTPASRPGLAPSDPISLAREYLRDIQLDLSMVGSDQEYIRRLEAAIPHPLAAVRVGVFMMLTSKEYSILVRYRDVDFVARNLVEWARRSSEARKGRVSVTPRPSLFYGGRELFIVRVVGAPGPGGAELALNPNRWFESNLDHGLEVAYETLYSAQEDEFFIIHREQLAALSKVGWITDQFGPRDPAAADAAERHKTRDASATSSTVPASADGPKVVK